MKHFLTEFWRRSRGRMPEPEATMWRSAETHVQLGFLTADWLRGNIRCLPGYYRNQPSAPARETSTLIETLVALNHAGFVTESSQPGRPAGPDPEHDDFSRQRAFVDGWCTGATVTRLQAALRHEPALVVRAWPVIELEEVSRGTCCDHHRFQGPVLDQAASAGHAIALTQICHHPELVGEPLADEGWCTVTSQVGTPSRTKLDARRKLYGDAAFAALDQGWFVLIVDTEWGNNERLWALLHQHALFMQFERRGLGGGSPFVLVEDELAKLHFNMGQKVLFKQPRVQF